MNRLICACAFSLNEDSARAVIINYVHLYCRWLRSGSVFYADFIHAIYAEREEKGDLARHNKPKRQA